MSNTYSINGSATLKTTGDNWTISLGTVNQGYNVTSSGIANNQPAYTSSWTQLYTGSNSTFRIGTFENTDTTSSILLAVTNTSSYSILQAGDVNVLTYSGSTPIWIKGQGANGAPILKYLIVGN